MNKILYRTIPALLGIIIVSLVLALFGFVPDRFIALAICCYFVGFYWAVATERWGDEDI